MPAPITLPVPSAGSTPDAPASIPYDGAPIPIPHIVADFAADETAITITLAEAIRIAPKLAGADALTDITLTAAAAGLVIVDATLPDTVDNLTLGANCAAGDWPDALIAALPDRSGADDGLYTDTETILTDGQITALEAKGFFSEV